MRLFDCGYALRAISEAFQIGRSGAFVTNMRSFRGVLSAKHGFAAFGSPVAPHNADKVVAQIYNSARLIVARLNQPQPDMHRPGIFPILTMFGHEEQQMKLPITGLHHITSIASDARINNDFFTRSIGLRRVKKTVNFDAPGTYHLYYGNATGDPGTVMTYFPFGGVEMGRRGTGEVGQTVFSVPVGTLAYWTERLSGIGVGGLKAERLFGENRLLFTGPDGDGFALAEVGEDVRAGWTGAGIGEAEAVRGFHSATLRLRDSGPTAELLGFMGYRKRAVQGNLTRYSIDDGNGADIIDLETLPDLGPALQGAGSVHHIAFAVPDRAAQLRVRQALIDTGYNVTPVIDRDYFWAIYFRTPGGILFEVATAGPGFDRDETPEHLGEALKLPSRHEGLRAQLEAYLDPIAG